MRLKHLIAGAALAALPGPPVALAHGAGHPGEFRGLGDRAKGGDYPAAAPAGFRTAIGGHMVFHGAAVAD